MPAKTFTLAGRRFVILPENEYKRLRNQAKRNGSAVTSRPKTGNPRLTAQDRGDIAESLRRLKEPGEVPIEIVRKRLRL